MSLKGMAAYEQLMRAVKAGARRAMYRSTVEALRYARGVSSGPFSLRDLAHLDHPYAARHGQVTGAVHPFWVNKQSGRFERAWLVMDVNRIKNPTYYASWLLTGTKKMLGRPYADAIREEWFRLRAAEIQREMARIGLSTRRRAQ